MAVNNIELLAGNFKLRKPTFIEKLCHKILGVCIYENNYMVIYKKTWTDPREPLWIRTLKGFYTEQIVLIRWCFVCGKEEGA